LPLFLRDAVDKFTQAASYVKICGVTSIEDAQIVIDAGAAALGLIFAESSRQLTLEEALAIARATEGSILRVGVFRHNDPDFVLRHVDATGVEIAQIHGELGQELVQALRERQVGIVKALSVGEPEFFDFDETTVDAVLIDGPSPGSGHIHTWGDLQRRNFARPVIAAGGLTALNVVEVLNITNAWGVDVSSGVESGHRRKDRAHVRDFVMNARQHFDQRAASRG
jgi:phosphoribosylanthranilate isomerase